MFRSATTVLLVCAPAMASTINAGQFANTRTVLQDSPHAHQGDRRMQRQADPPAGG